MSRIERERRQQAEERWPQLRSLLSGEIGGLLYGDVKPLVHRLSEFASGVAPSDCQATATECRDFLAYFKGRHDEWQFMRDGFAVPGGKPADDRGRGHTALDRVKLIYDAFATAARADRPMG